MPDIDNADKIFEEEPDTRDDFERALDDVEPDMKGYLKAVRGLIQPGLHSMVAYKPKPFEHRTVLFDLTGINQRFDSKERMQKMVSDGWSLRPDLTLEHEGHFLVTFQREREPDSSVKNDSANSVADSEKSSVENG